MSILSESPRCSGLEAASPRLFHSDGLQTLPLPSDRSLIINPCFQLLTFDLPRYINTQRGKVEPCGAVAQWVVGQPQRVWGRAWDYQDMATPSSAIRIGVVGYGHLGQYLVQRILQDGAAVGLTLAFVWNRNSDKLKGLIPDDVILSDLTRCADRRCDVIVEVCHPQIVKEFGVHFLSRAHFMVGSPSALSDSDLNKRLREAAQQHGHTLYVPSGALWGGQDIQRMNDSGSLKALFIRMSKHPSCFRLTGDVLSDWTEGEGRRVLYRGSVAELCPLAPNNVNTMAAAAVAAGALGFAGVQGEIVSDTALSDFHVVEVEVTGLGGFTVNTLRRNPAKLGAVTGSATYNSFWNSLLTCKGHGGRVHLC